MVVLRLAGRDGLAGAFPHLDAAGGELDGPARLGGGAGEAGVKRDVAVQRKVGGGDCRDVRGGSQGDGGVKAGRKAPGDIEYCLLQADAQAIDGDALAVINGGRGKQADDLRLDARVVGGDLQRGQPERLGRNVQQRGGGDLGVRAGGGDVGSGLDVQRGLRAVDVHAGGSGHTGGVDLLRNHRGLDGRVRQRVGDVGLDRGVPHLLAGQAGLSGFGVEVDLALAELDVGNHAAADRLADQGAEVFEAGEPYRRLALGKGGVLGEGEVAVGVEAAPVGLVDGGVQGAVGGAAGIEGEMQRGAVEGAFAGDAPGRGGREAGEVGGELDRAWGELLGADVAGQRAFEGEVVEWAVDAGGELGIALQGRGHEGEVGQADLGAEVDALGLVRANGGKGDCSALQGQAVDGDVLALHLDSEAELGIGADEGGGRRRAASDGERAVSVQRGEVGVSLDVETEGGMALDHLPGGFGQRGEFRQGEHGVHALVAGRQRGALEIDQRVGKDIGGGASRLVKPDVDVELERGVSKQIGLWSGDAQAGEDGAEIHRPLVAGEVGFEGLDRRARRLDAVEAQGFRWHPGR